MKSRLFLLVVVIAGCTAAPPPPAPEPAAPKVARAPVPAAAPEPAPAPPPPAAPQKAEVPSNVPASPPPVSSTPKAPPATKAPAPAKTEAPAAVATRPAAAAPLDLRSLEQRLKDTGAIGVLTKLSLKNQVDDLVGRFKAFHGGQRPPTLGDLRPAFELMLMKVLSLLQDKDAALARDINASREAIWGVLADHDKFAKYTS